MYTITFKLLTCNKIHSTAKTVYDYNIILPWYAVNVNIASVLHKNEVNQLFRIPLLIFHKAPYIYCSFPIQKFCIWHQRIPLTSKQL